APPAHPSVPAGADPRGHGDLVGGRAARGARVVATHARPRLGALPGRVALHDRASAAHRGHRERARRGPAQRARVVRGRALRSGRSPAGRVAARPRGRRAMFDPRHRSRALTEGAGRAPARALLRATGLTDQDLARPIIGVANTWTETMPCNHHLRRLADALKQRTRSLDAPPTES